MKTEDLLDRLSLNDSWPERWSPSITLPLAAATAGALALILSVALLTPRVDLIAALGGKDHAVLVKFAFALSVVAAAFPIVRNLTAPGRTIGLMSLIVLLPFVVATLLALRELVALPADELRRLTADSSWLSCLWQIPALGFPAFVILALCARRLAPTNLARAGAYIGLMAGGIGALGYALHCHDDSILFVAIAYTLAIGEMSLFGSFLGPRFLRWS